MANGNHYWILSNFSGAKLSSWWIYAFFEHFFFKAVIQICSIFSIGLFRIWIPPKKNIIHTTFYNFLLNIYFFTAIQYHRIRHRHMGAKNKFLTNSLCVSSVSAPIELRVLEKRKPYWKRRRNIVHMCVIFVRLSITETFILIQSFCKELGDIRMEKKLSVFLTRVEIIC